jgi:hypothetical protein
VTPWRRGVDAAAGGESSVSRVDHAATSRRTRGLCPGHEPPPAGPSPLITATSHRPKRRTTQRRHRCECRGVGGVCLSPPGMPGSVPARDVCRSVALRIALSRPFGGVSVCWGGCQRWVVRWRLSPAAPCLGLEPDDELRRPDAEVAT